MVKADWTLDRVKMPRKPPRRAGLDLPLIKVPTLPVFEAISNISEAYRPIVELGRQVQAIFENLSTSYAEPLKRLVLEGKKCERLESAGWLVHYSSPYALVEAEPASLEDLDARIEEYYRTEWPAIREDFAQRVGLYEVDDEARAVFAEALAAHDAGLFRCPARLLYPEIERLARKEIHGGAMDKMASQDRLREAIGGLTPNEFPGAGIAGLHFYRKLTKHLYANINDKDALERISADPVPNRHATVHGLATYSSFKSSINALIVADYLFRAISTIKQLETDQSALDDRAA